MSGLVVTPTLNGVTKSVYAALAPFIIAVTGLAPANVIQGIQNRASMPEFDNFVLIQALTRHRLRTNLHDYSVANAGNVNIQEGVELAVQIDCYGTSAEDWATMLSSTLRDEYGCTALGPNVQPLYADDARLIPLVAGEEQYEERWSVDARFQYNPVTTPPQQYATALALGMIDVDVAYPP